MIESLDEGSATFAAKNDIPDAVGWSSVNDLLIAIFNAIQIQTMVGGGGIPKDKRNLFEMAESPIMAKLKKITRKNRAKPKAKGHSVLNEGPLDSVEALPDFLRSKKSNPKE